MYVTVRLMNLISATVISGFAFAFIVNFSLPYKSIGKYTVILNLFDGLNIIIIRRDF